MSMTSSLKTIECPSTEESVFVLRYPLLNNSIRIGTKLLVGQNQVAVFVEDGEVLDVLPEGIHTLSVEALPKLAAKKHWDRRFNAAFRSEIYFISLTLFQAALATSTTFSLILSQFLYKATPMAMAAAMAATMPNIGSATAPNVIPSVVPIVIREPIMDTKPPNIIMRGPRAAVMPTSARANVAIFGGWLMKSMNC